MIHEAIDTAFAIWDALVITIVVLAFVGTVVLLSGLALGTWAVKRVWRALRGLCGASDGPDVGLDVREAPEASDGRSADPGYREAA